MNKRKITNKPLLVAMDLEGCLIPEIWINISNITGIKELSLTTRDIKDYNVLMQKRLNILKSNKLTIGDIQKIISQIKPLNGAIEFLNWLRSLVPFVILSDTFYPFAEPIMQKLNLPTILCHTLVIKNDEIIDYKLRIKDAKAKCVKAFQKLGFKVCAIGDSYNDISMLQKADEAYFLHAPEKITNEFPKIKSHKSILSLTNSLKELLNK